MVGGATSGYWAIGNCDSATAPTMTMTIESTVARIGRSMKTCENIGRLLTLGFLVGCFGGRPRHGNTFRLDLCPVAHPLVVVHDDPILRLKPRTHGFHAIAQPVELDVAAFGGALGV